MPLVHLVLPQSMPPEQRRLISEGVHQALADTMAVPANGMFQLITPYDAQTVAMSPDFLGVARGPAFTVIQISVMQPRGTEEKRALMRAIRNNLTARAGLADADMMINVVETEAANWFCVVK